MEMNDQLKAALREILMERFGVDIYKARCHFSTQNYAFVFLGEPFMIRVSATPKKTRSEILSELMWLDDLKQFKQTVCEPNLSLAGKLLEDFEIDGKHYRASMFRTARGVIREINDFTPMFFICCGDLLGAIHHVSTDEREKGFHFKRGNKADDFAALKARVHERIPAPMLERINQIEAQVEALPRELGRYGLCHGDFHVRNFFVEENNIWLFDFDGCGYAHYLYDVASFVQACFLFGYGVGKDLRKVMNEELLPYFKIGYTIRKKCDDHFWDNLDLFMTYRTALTYMALCEIDHVGVVDDTQKVKRFFGYLMSQGDVMAAMTNAMKQIGCAI